MNCLRLSLTCTSREEAEHESAKASLQDVDAVMWTPKIEKEISAWMGGRVPSPMQSITSSAFAACTELSVSDARVFYHLATLAGHMQQTGAHTFAFSIWCMPEFIGQAIQHPCAKAALLALGSHHLCSITRSSALEQLAQVYLTKACASLNRAICEFSEDNADAVLAASVMLGWSTSEKCQYAKILQGTSAIMRRMKERGYQCGLDVLSGELEPLPVQNRRVVVAYLGFSEDDLTHMRPLSAGLQRLLASSCHVEVRTAARALLDFMRNLRLKRVADPVEQMETFNTVKSWIPWAPVATLGLGWRSIPVLLMMCYYHTVSIAAEPYLPAAVKAVFPHKRTQVIGRIYTALADMKPSYGDLPITQAEIDEALDQVTICMVYAVRYRTLNIGRW
ncbi:hypothetical protein LTS10_005587 [Elasticomyces elasticus]|nr:hypothetical protein LTS10_005587 [Elasticomyces elasticus]